MQRENYIDALRGYAILGVITVHTSLLFPSLPWFIKGLSATGARGVQLFFVASAFTLMRSWHHRNDGLVPFYIRRAFRIAPIFWIAIAIYTAVALVHPPKFWMPTGFHWSDVWLTAAFLHVWNPGTLWVVPGGWSIGVEMTFYLVFPLLTVVLTTMRRAAAALAAALIVAPLANHLARPFLPAGQTTLNEFFLSLWLPSQLPAFLIGILAYHAASEWHGRFRHARLEATLAIIVALCLSAPLWSSCPGVAPWWLNAFYAALFGIALFALHEGAGRWLINPQVVRLGIASYSAYLVHFLPLKLAEAAGVKEFGAGTAGFLPFLAIIILLVFFCSRASFQFIERPFNELGRNRARFYEHRHDGVSAGFLFGRRGRLKPDRPR